MAYVVRLCCLISILLINTSNGGLPVLEDLEESSQNGRRADLQLNKEPLSVSKMMVTKYKCHQCEPPDCTEEGGGEMCDNALYCFKSSVRGSNGGLQHTRGCSSSSDHYQLTCFTSRTQGVRKRHACQQNVTCCMGNMCNDGTFPELPPIADTTIEPLASNTWKLWVTVVVSALTILALGAMAIFIIRRRSRVSRAALHKLGMDSNYYPPNLNVEIVVLC